MCVCGGGHGVDLGQLVEHNMALLAINLLREEPRKLKSTVGG